MSGDTAPFGFPKRPGSPARPGGLEAAVAAGRRRLRRSALWSAGAVLSVVGVVAGATLVGPAGDDALVLVPASPLPDAEASRSPSPEPTAGSSPAPGPGAASPGTGSAPSGGPGGVGGEPAQVEGGGGPGAVPGTSDRRTPYREQPSTITTYGSCMDSGLVDGADPDELCVQEYAGSDTVRTGEEIRMQVDVCTSLRRPRSARLAFSDGQEHDLVVRSDEGALWTWSRRHTFPEGEHVRELAPGNCLTWVTVWDTRDDSGRLLLPGVYTVRHSVEVNGSWRSVEAEVEVTE